MGRSRVAVLKTAPATVIDDYKRLMRLADYRQFLPQDKQTALKINVSWQYFYPACSTTPWQLDGVIATLLEDGYCKQNIFGWVWRPMGNLWWYHEPWYMHRLYYGHWNPQFRPGNREWFRNNVNVYNRWPRNSVVTPSGIQGRIGPAGGQRPSPQPPGDFYAG